MALSLSTLAADKMISGFKVHLRTILEVGQEGGYEHFGKFYSHCDRIAEATLGIMDFLNIEDVELRRDLRVKLLSCKERLKGIRRLVSLYANNDFWFNWQDPGHLHIFARSVIIEIRQLNQL